MDKIQAAIAKARAAREEQAKANVTLNAPARRAMSKDRPETPPETMALMPDDRAAIWQPLATFAPSASHMARQRVIGPDGGLGSAEGAAVFDMLRTKVIQQMRANGWRRLAITSPSSHCGKTTVALNLAFALAKQAEVHTILAEMDLRRPSIAAKLGVSGRNGFASVLAGITDFADVAMRPRTNLALAMNFAKARNTSELLQSSQTGKVLSDIEQRFAPDLMIFDMPPMLRTDDTIAFMGQVDCVLLVAGAEATTLDEIDTCENDLSLQTNVLGVVLNKCRYMDGDAGDASYY